MYVKHWRAYVTTAAVLHSLFMEVYKCCDAVRPLATRKKSHQNGNCTAILTMSPAMIAGGWKLLM